MRRFFPLIALGALVLGGCAISDYPALTQPMNMSHGVLDCPTGDRMANTQQTFERDLLSLEMVRGDWNPIPLGYTVGKKDAKEWGRFIGPYLAYNEIKVFGSGAQAGHWSLSGLKGLPNGDRRISTWYRRSTGGAWTCVWSTAGGKLYGSGPEGYVLATPMQLYPDMAVETIAIDTAPGTQWRFNVVATTPWRIGGGYSTMVGYVAEADQGKLLDTPITRTAGLAEFFAGESLTVEHLGATWTGRGELRDDGHVIVRFDEVTYNGSTFTPSVPIEAATGPNLKLLEFDLDGQKDQVIELAEWALEHAPLDQEIYLGGFIPELGISGPEVSIEIGSEAIENWLATETSQIQPRERDRIR
jgi:hypothetical protein